jgi:cellulose synthase (UDP-forming)
VLVLDADHVPAQDMLKRTVGHFLADPKLALVQTPHFFLNPDPIERNLGTFATTPSENEMFYGRVQRGLDFWNAAFFCGSAALLRREALVKVGGIAGVSVTEDAETALELHSRGYRSLYVDRPMVAGLSPDTLAAFIGQRGRWAQGMLQILLLKNPLWKRGLTLPQRLCYLNSSVFWLFPLSRAVFLLAPLCYLFFGMRIFEGTLQEFVAFTLPHVLIVLFMSNHTFGRFRWPFFSDLYETVQALHLSRALANVLLHPRKVSFKVTPKAETIDHAFVSAAAGPIFALFAFLLAGEAFGLYRMTTSPLETQHLAIVLTWNSINLVLALGAVGAAFERAVVGWRAWVPRRQPVELETPAGHVPAVLTGVTMQSAVVKVAGSGLPYDLDRTALWARVPGRELPARFQAALEEASPSRDGLELRLRFLPAGLSAEADLVRLNYGDSVVWAAFLETRRRRRSVPATLLRLAGMGLRRSLELAGFLIRPEPAPALAIPTFRTPVPAIALAKGSEQ